MCVLLLTEALNTIRQKQMQKLVLMSYLILLLSVNVSISFFICAFDILWSWLSNLFLLLLQLVSAFGHKKLRDLLHFQINIAQMLLTLAFE